MDELARGKYYDEFVVGEQHESPGRTITEADLVMYTGLSGDYNQLHTDEEYCKRIGVFGRRIVHGLFALTIAEGLKSRVGEFEGTSLASLEWTWRFTAPLFVGDTVYSRWSVTTKRETRKPDRGIVTQQVQLVNQNGETVGEGQHVVMMQRKTE